MKSPFDLDYENATEHAHQQALFQWAAVAASFGLTYANDTAFYNIKNKSNIAKLPVPELNLLYAIHNQGNQSAIQGARARAEGVKAGVPDLCLPVSIFEYGKEQACGLYIELKRPSLKREKNLYNGCSEEQIYWLKTLENQGYKAYVCYGWLEARDAILSYLRKD